MGTHHIFESDFDCLTDRHTPYTMVEFKDVGKASKDLFKKPFNVNQFDVDFKTGSYVIKNSVKGDSMATSFEMKGADVLCGLVPDVQQPHKTTIAGGQMKCELNRAFVSGANNLSCDFNTNTTMETGATAYVFKAKLASDCGLIAGLEATPAGPSSIKYHATYPFKNMTFGVAGGLANPTALNYAIQSESSHSRLISPISALTSSTRLMLLHLSVSKPAGKWELQMPLSALLLSVLWPVVPILTSRPLETVSVKSLMFPLFHPVSN